MELTYLESFNENESADYNLEVILTYFKKILKDYIKNYEENIQSCLTKISMWSEEQQVEYLDKILTRGSRLSVIILEYPSKSDIENNVNIYSKDLEKIIALVKFLDNKIKLYEHYFYEFYDKKLILRKIKDLDIRLNTSNIDSYAEFEDLIGNTITKINIKEYPDEVVFHCKGAVKNKIYCFQEEYDESVYIEEICGNIDNLIDSPIIKAKEIIHYNKYEVRTFHKIATKKGNVTIKWCGDCSPVFEQIL